LFQHSDILCIIAIQLYWKIWLFIEPVQKQALKFLAAALIIEKRPISRPSVSASIGGFQDG
jgi:hypothetical protein